jgi:hypothetical protein
MKPSSIGAPGARHNPNSGSTQTVATTAIGPQRPVRLTRANYEAPLASPVMLGFERRIVAALTSASDPKLRAAVAGWVDDTLRDMPEHLRLGVLAESIGLGLWATVRRSDDSTLVRILESSPLWPVRQYVRLLKGLVLFAEHELADVAVSEHR